MKIYEDTVIEKRIEGRWLQVRIPENVMPMGYVEFGKSQGSQKSGKRTKARAIEGKWDSLAWRTETRGIRFMGCDFFVL